MVPKIIYTKTKHGEFRNILIKFSLNVWGKFPVYWSLKLQHSKNNLFGFERLYFYEVTFKHSCKKCSQSLVQKSEIHILNSEMFHYLFKLIINKLGRYNTKSDNC